MKKIFLIIITSLSVLPAVAQSQEYDWLLIYYMPYDNNLSFLSSTIIDQFKNNAINKKTCITLQADLAGPGGMMRYTFNSQVDSIKIDSESSASYKALEDYLKWVSTNFKAKHYSIILLNHGGLLNEYGLDEFPNIQWIGIDQLAKAIKKFNSESGIKKIDLLYEQICTRSTIENLYEFKDIANYTLASQNLVPAPGYYYASVFSKTDGDTVKTGAALADLIVHNEREDMYYSYSLINNSKWNEWILEFTEYASSTHSINTPVVKDSLKILSYWGGVYVDFASVLKATDSSINSGKINYSKKLFDQGKLLEKLYLNPCNDLMTGYCGISIFAPFRSNEKFLSIYKLKEFSAWIDKIRDQRRH